MTRTYKRRALKNRHENDTTSGGGGVLQSISSYHGGSKANTTRTTTTIRKISLRDEDFSSTALGPRNISVIYEPDVTTWEHFGTQPPKQDHVSFYKSHVSPDTTVWVTPGQEFLEKVANGYRVMHHDNACDAQFVHFSTEKIFISEDTQQLRWEFSDHRVWKTERQMQMVAKPCDDRKDICWHRPPVLQPEVQPGIYKFDIRPDCAYWLSLQGFNDWYTEQVKQRAFVVNDCITCPYLFIEVNKDGKDPQTANSQVAAAASLALYNWFELRKNAIQLRTTVSTKISSVDDMKTYGITFAGAADDVWCIQPDSHEDSQKWVGCSMRHVSKGNCELTSGVEILINWTNEIHRWGLTIHGKSCEADIKTCIAKRMGARVSEIH